MIETKKLILAHRNNLNLNRVKGDLEFKIFNYLSNVRDFRGIKRCVFFSAKVGQTIALVGSGSGKSTLASEWFTFYEPNAGEYLIDGKNQRIDELTELRDQMAIVPQDVLLFGGTIRDNILYSKPSY